MALETVRRARGKLTRDKPEQCYGNELGWNAEITPLRGGGVVYSLCAKRGIPGGQPVCRARRTALS